MALEMKTELEAKIYDFLKKDNFQFDHGFIRKTINAETRYPGVLLDKISYYPYQVENLAEDQIIAEFLDEYAEDLPFRMEDKLTEKEFLDMQDHAKVLAWLSDHVSIYVDPESMSEFLDTLVNAA
jgi:hypothetical protein